MRMIERFRGIVAPLGASLLVVAAAGSAGAQSATISGTVTKVTGQPVPGANVFIRELNIGATSNDSGRYVIRVDSSRVKSQRVTLTARFIGFVPHARPITLTPGPQTQNLTLPDDPFRLEEVVVTGVSQATSSRNLAFSVAKVDEMQIKQVPAQSPVAALAGKIAGVRVSMATGNPGGNPAIRIRGSTNLDVGGSTPMIIVDGVITQNNLSDIDGNDIESIEVLKGAAAASFYGSAAANGVINITTKRGKNLVENNLAVTARTEYGQSDLPHMIPLNHSHFYTVDAAGNPTYTPKADKIADVPYPTTGPGRWRNQLDTWMTNGQFYSTNVQVGMRRGNTNWNGSFTNDHTQGTLPLTSGDFRQNARVNIDQGLTSKADMSASVTYGVQNNDYDPNGSQGIFALLQAPPNVDLQHPSSTDPVDYFAQLPNDFSSRGNPLYGLANDQFNQRRERILGSFAVRYRPWEWLHLEGSYGTDRLNQQQRDYQFRGYYNTDGTPTKGSIDDRNWANIASNQQISATSSHLWFNNLLATTRVAGLYEATRNQFDRAGGSNLTISDVPALDAIDPVQNYTTSSLEETKTTDYMASQSLDFKDRYLFDVLYRRDGSSLFGADNRWADFYRVSGAYRINEDLHIPGFQELKLRAARGTAGLRPRFEAQYETYSLSGGQFSKQNLGNADLRPAIQTEDEYGINAAFLDRFDLELVYASRITKGAFLDVPLSSAQSGGFLNQWQNAADVSAKTGELSLNTRVYEGRNFGYNFVLTGDKTTQRIDRMATAPFRVNAGGQGQNVFYYKPGEVLGIIYGTRWVRSFDELKQMTAYANANPADYVVNSAGFLVPVKQRGTTGEMPIKFVDATGNNQFTIGNVNPDFSFGWANNVRFHNFNVYALFDGQKGGQVYNFNKQWMFQDYRAADEDQSGKPQDQKIAVTFYSAGLYNGLEANDYFVEDASYLKLREFSVGYTLDQSLLNRVGLGHYAKGVKLALIGRNLYTWTHYSGFDPDVTSGGDFNFRIEGFRPPQFRTLTGQVEFTF
jgi:TonB-linked SusC/RagA family outer membrane protein